jgi:hypothetical protein
MHGICFDYNAGLVEFKIPKTKISPDFIFDALQEDEFQHQPTAKIVWLAENHLWNILRNQNSWEMTLTFMIKENFNIQTNNQEGEWLVEMLLKNPFLTLKSTLFKK